MKTIKELISLVFLGAAGVGFVFLSGAVAHVMVWAATTGWGSV